MKDSCSFVDLRGYRQSGKRARGGKTLSTESGEKCPLRGYPLSLLIRRPEKDICKKPQIERPRNKYS